MEQAKLKQLKFTILLVFSVINISILIGQQSEESPVSFSGIVFNSDSLNVPLGQVNIIVNKKKGTSSNAQGEFSINVSANDTIVFSHIGYYPTTVFIPDSIREGKLVAKLFLVSDTVDLEQVVINLLNEYENFKKSFLTMSKNDDKELVNAQNNINLSIHEARTTTEWTVEDKLENALQKEANKSIYYGQIPPENMVNFISIAAGLVAMVAQKKREKR